MLGNINLFLNRLTVEEIAKLDKNKDGRVTGEEAEDGLFQFKDRFSDAEFISLTGTTAEKTPQGKTSVPTTSSDVPEEAKTPAELRTYFTKMKDSFIESYIKGLLESGELEESGKKSLILYINTNARAYIEDYIKNAKAPYDTQAVYAEFEEYIAEKIEDRKAAQEVVQTQLDDVKNNTDANYEKLQNATEKADKEYITKDEYKELKADATDYILGIMAKGEQGGEFDAFMTALNPKYKDNINYKVAQKALELLETEQDPFKIQEIINNAKTAIGKLIGDIDEYGDGTTPLTDAVKARTKFIDNKKYSQQLDVYIDKMIEQASNEDSDGKFDPDAAKARMDALKTAFLSQYQGDGTDLEKAYSKFVTKAGEEYEKVQAEIHQYQRKYESHQKGTLNDINKAIEAAGTYISSAEKDSVYNAAVDYVMNKILNNQDDKLLASINAKYVYFPQFIEAKSLIDNLMTSASPEADFAKAKELIKDLLQSQGIEKIKQFARAENERIEKEKAVEESKNVNLSNDSSLKVYLWGYHSNDTLGNDDDVYTNFKVENGKVVWTHQDDAADINKTFSQLNQRIHAKLKEQLGALYNPEEIEKYFNEAMVKMAMSLPNNNQLSNISDLVDIFLRQFDKIATNGLQKVPSAVSPDRLDKVKVLEAADAFGDYTSGIHGGSWHRRSPNTAWNEARNEARNYLNKLTNSILEQYQAKLGDKFDPIAITKMINQVIESMVNDNSNFIDINSHHNGSKWGFNTSTLYDFYFAYLNDAFKAYLEQAGITL